MTLQEKFWTAAVILLVVLFATGERVAAQATGRLVGRVTDSSGGVMPGANVTTLETGTGTQRSVVTNESGEYVVSGLPVGTYKITIAMSGFNEMVFSGIDLHVGAQVRVDGVLKIADLRQSVEVTATARLIETERGAQENRVLGDQVMLMPLNARDPLELMTLTAGVSNGQISGNRDTAVNYQVEGSTSQNLIYNSPAGIPPIDSVAEFSIKTGIATADSGLGGSVVQVAVRSGTNRYHGSLYDFYRGSFLEARNFFTPPDAPKGRLMRNQAGGSIGGPVLRNRTFFFVNLESRRASTTVVSRVTVPTMDERRGDFRNSGVAVLDPFNGRQPFPGNVIPANRFNSASLTLLSYIPEPNLPGTVNNYFANLDATNNELLTVARMDHNFTSSHRLMAMARSQNADQMQPRDVPGFGGRLFDNKSLSFTARYDAIIGPRWLNQVTVSWLQDDSDTLPELKDKDVTSELGFAATLSANDPAAQNGFPDLYLRGLYRFLEAGRDPSVNSSGTTSISNDLSHTRGDHVFKFGGTVLWARLDQSSVERQRPFIDFRNTHTGAVMGDFLLGTPYSISMDVGGGVAHMTRSYFAGYAMDDWRIKPRLTVNLGVRYELYTVPIERNNRLSTYDFETGGVIVASNNGQLPTSIILPLFSNPNIKPQIPIRSNVDAGLPRGLGKADTNNVMPRTGFAYRFTSDNSTVLRGGYGWFYSPIRMLVRLLGGSRNPPFMLRGRSDNTNKNSILTFQQVADNFGIPTVTGTTIVGVQPDFEDALSQQWNLTLEREIGWGTAVRVSYVGNRATHLPVRIDYNQPKLVSGADGVPTLVTLNPNFASIDVHSSVARSIYHAGEFEVRKQLSQGLSFQVNWTWAKLLSQAEEDNARPQDSYNLDAEWGDASYQRRHIVNMNFMYELPAGPGRAWLESGWLSHVLGGWRLTGVGRFMTGLRYSPNYSTVDADVDIRSGRPDRIGDPNSGPKTPEQWFNISAFALPVAGGSAGLRFGNSARNLVVGPGFRSVDLGLQKQVKVGRHGKLTLRIESFNAFNQVNFDGNSMVVDLTSRAAGSMSATLPAREFQFGLRWDF